MNAELVMVEGRKMSRSLNNTLPLARLRQNGYSGRDVRFFLLGVHYRKPVNYSDGALQTARNTVKKINTFISRLNAVNSNGQDHFAETDQLIYNLKHDFMAALDDDLNIAGALAALFNFIGKVNSPLTNGLINKKMPGKFWRPWKMLTKFWESWTLKTGRSKEIKELIDKREAARNARNWKEADSYRAKLAELGVDISDTPHGVVWRFR